MAGSFHGIGTTGCRGRGFVRWNLVKGNKGDCDGMECFVILMIPLIPYNACHFCNWKVQHYQEYGDDVEEWRYQSFPIRYSSSLLLRTFARYWITFFMVAMLFTAAPLFGLMLLADGKPGGIPLSAFCLAICAARPILWWTDRKTRSIRLLLGRHKYGSSDPADWTREVRDTIAVPPDWWGTDTFAQAVNGLLRAGHVSDAMWAARLTLAMEDRAEGERLTNEVLAHPKARKVLSRLRKDPGEWPEIIKRAIDKKLPRLDHSRRDEELEPAFKSRPRKDDDTEDEQYDERPRSRRRQPRPWHQQPLPYILGLLGILGVSGVIWLALALGRDAGQRAAGPVPVPPAPQIKQELPQGNQPPLVNNPPPIVKDQPAPAKEKPAPVEPPAKPAGPPKVTGDANLDKLLANLEKDANARRVAAEDLAKMQPNEHRAVVAQKLTQHLQEPNVFTRKAVIRALGVWGTSNEVPTLIELLGHKDRFIRQEVLGIIGKLRDERALTPVIQCYLDFVTRGPAKQALIDMGPMAEKQVLGLVSHNDVFVRWEAVKILKEIGTRQSLPTLQFLASSNQLALAQSAREALQAISLRAMKN